MLKGSKYRITTSYSRGTYYQDRFMFIMHRKGKIVELVLTIQEYYCHISINYPGVTWIKMEEWVWLRETNIRKNHHVRTSCHMTCRTRRKLSGTMFGGHALVFLSAFCFFYLFSFGKSDGKLRCAFRCVV